MNFRDLGTEPLAGTTTAEFVIRPLRPSDAELDYEAVMESREFLRTWEQDTWPAEDFTVAANREDLAGHERDADLGDGYTYTVMNRDESECLGCIYIYSPAVQWIARDPKTPVADDSWDAVDAAVYFWIRTSRLAEGTERRLLDVLRLWLDKEWPFDNLVFVTNEDLIHQVEMLENTDMQRRFLIGAVDEPGTYVAYA